MADSCGVRVRAGDGAEVLTRLGLGLGVGLGIHVQNGMAQD